ncbi:MULTISPECIES: MFS transporter [unclassified Solwaraspora]|uniref:MFS transporter n=1 Tax=unclassified Solwaraspora TaxID=2627926 RepID=UPI00248AFD68|nr:MULTISPECIES: MFS transporter [unclassified Solwaraspora]WBB99547.1 MFS transporter [Solwaraspora sp. WMMA2059]WBC21903.1 MFS transporter [Solwaraspora sp. WMMA2080]WJK36052.1 MFS transporter [Solwaraspora sp. WMMA2065]
MTAATPGGAPPVAAFGPPGLPREVYVLSVVGGCVMLGLGLVLPVLPVYAATFGAGPAQIGALVALFALMRLATSPFCGRLAAWFGERRVLVAGLLLCAVCSALAAFAGSYGQLLVFRGLGGVGSVLFSVSALATLLAVAPADQRGRASAVFEAGFLLGGICGPALGGLLALIALSAPFLVYAALLLAATVLTLAVLRTDARHGTDPGRAAVRLPVLLRDRRYLVACTAALAQGWVLFGLRSALVPTVVVAWGHDVAWVGWAFTISAVVQALLIVPAGRVVDRAGRRPAMIAGTGVAATAITALVFVDTYPWLVVGLCAYAAGSALLNAAPAALIGDVVAGRAGSGVAVFSMCTDVGAVVGPVVVGLVAEQAGAAAAFGSGAALLVVAFAAAWTLTTVRPTTAVPPTRRS